MNFNNDNLEINLTNLIDSWNTTPASEITRFKKTKENKKFLNELNPHVMIQYLRAQEIKNKLKDTHYVFTYGTSSLLAVLLKIKNLSEEKLFKNTLSINQKSSGVKNVSEFMKKYPEPTLKQLGDSIIPVDSNIRSTLPHRSSLSCVNKNSDILSKHQRNYIDASISSIFAVDEVAMINKIRENLSELSTEKFDTGVLWVIAVPKAVIKNYHSNFCYAAKDDGTFSKKMRDYSENNQKTFLQELEKSQKCQVDNNAPRFMLLAEGLHACTEAKVICCAQKI